MVVKQFIKYLIVGTSGVLIDLGTLSFFAEILRLIPWMAVACSQIIVIGYNFCLNKYWSFRNKEMPHGQLVRYLSLAGANYVLGVGLMYLFNEVWGVQYLAVRVGTIALMVVWNFLLYKYWVFRENVIHTEES